MMSPSAGITSPASTRMMSPTLRSLAAVMTTSPAPPSESSLALVVTRADRRESAAALPLPSATLSAKLANSTVAHSQSATWRAKAAAA